VVSNESNQSDIGKSTVQTLRALKGALLALYRLYPGAVIALLVLGGFFGFLISRSELASQAIAVLVVFLVSIAIYFREESYSQAILAFVIGLLPALSMSWSSGRFWLFVGGFVALNGLFFIVVSIRIAANNEQIYKQAAAFAMREDRSITDKKLETLAKRAGTSFLGPIEKAECVRQLMFRNFPIQHLPEALKSIEKMSVITDIPAQEVASYLVILYPLVDATGVSFSHLDDRFYLTLRDSAATPEEFFEAFRLTRSLVLERRMDLDDYLNKLSTLLDFGLPPEEIRQRMEATK
jgi:hypothetical protein